MPLRLANNGTIDTVSRFQKWCASTLRVPAGISAGQPFFLHDFQLQFLRAYLAQEDGSPKYRTLSFSLPRKTGKSTFMAALLIGRCTPDSPIYRPNFRATVVAPTAKFAGYIPAAAELLWQTSGRETGFRYSRSPDPGKLIIGDGEVRMLSGDAKSGHGDDVDLSILDEAGLFPLRQAEIFDATYNSLAARDGSQILTGTRLDSPKFAEILDRPTSSSYVQLHAADQGCDPSDPTQWEKATPGGFKIKSKSFVKDAYERAAASNAMEDFKTSHLNLPGNPVRELLIDYDTLARVYRDDPEICTEEPVHIGLDLGGSSSMTAATIAYETSGTLKFLGAFPSGELSLSERGKRDNVSDLWVRCQTEGTLIETDGMVSDIPQFLHALLEVIGPHPVASISCDRYRQSELQNALAQAKLGWKPVFRGQGPRDGDNDIRATRRLFKAGAVQMRRTLILEAALAESDVKRATTGASQLDKSHWTARIDIATSLILACSALLRARETVAPEMEVTVL